MWGDQLEGCIRKRADLKSRISKLRKKSKKDPVASDLCDDLRVQLQIVDERIAAIRRQQEHRPYAYRRTMVLAVTAILATLSALLVPYLPKRRNLTFGNEVVRRHTADVSSARVPLLVLDVPLRLNSGPSLQIQKIRAVLSDDLDRKELQYHWSGAVDLSGNRNDPSAIVASSSAGVNSYINTSLDTFIQYPRGTFIADCDEFENSRVRRVIPSPNLALMQEGEMRYYSGSFPAFETAVTVTSQDGNTLAPFIVRLAAKDDVRCVLQAISGEKVVAHRDVTTSVRKWAQFEIARWEQQQARSSHSTKHGMSGAASQTMESPQ